MAARRQVIKLPHHEQAELCTTRPNYRQGRRLTAVKVDGRLNDESQHLIVSGVPSLGLQDDLRKLCSRFGDVTSLVYVPDYTEEKFVEAYHIRYARIQSARFAKRHMDGRTFFGGSLHVCYAPEMESVIETKSKLLLRRHEVTRRCNAAVSEDDGQQVLRLSAVNHLPSTQQSHPESNCIWNGVSTASDPRLLPSLKNIEEVDINTYGPALPTSDWRNCGVKETRYIPRQQSGNRKHCTRVQKPHTNQPFSSPLPSCNSGTASSEKKKSSPPVLKLIPTQVKGAVKRIIIHRKNVLEECKVPASGNASLDATILSVRERVRNVGVPNVKVALEKKDNHKTGF